MPRITHPNGTTAVVSDAAVRFWTTKAGWRLDEPAAGGPAPKTTRKRTRTRRPPAPRAGKPAAPKTSPPPDAGDPDESPGQGSSTTAPTKE